MASARFPRGTLLRSIGDCRAGKRPIERREWVGTLAGGGGLTYHPLDLVGRVALPADGKQRRGGREIDRIHDALDLGGDRHAVARTVLAGGAHGVGACRPLDAVITLAIPDETGIALLQRIRPGKGGLARRARDRDRRGGVFLGLKIP